MNHIYLIICVFNQVMSTEWTDLHDEELEKTMRVLVEEDEMNPMMIGM